MPNEVQLPQLPDGESLTLGEVGTAHYPDRWTHTWGAFAYLVVEAGGYGDLEAVNPYTGDRLNVGVFHVHNVDGTYDWGRADPEVNPYEGLRRLIESMEKIDFLHLKIPVQDRLRLAGEREIQREQLRERTGIEFPSPPIPPALAQEEQDARDAANAKQVP